MNQLELLNKIENTKEELYAVANNRQLTDPLVVTLSQKLDLYIVQYQLVMAGKLPFVGYARII